MAVFFSATRPYCTVFSLLLPLFLPSLPLWQAGTEKAVVYPGKLPIVSGGNSLWESAPRKPASANRNAASAAAAAGPPPPCVHWDLVPGVRWPSPGTGRDGEVETTEGKHEKTISKKEGEGTEYGGKWRTHMGIRR